MFVGLIGNVSTPLPFLTSSLDEFLQRTYVASDIGQIELFYHILVFIIDLTHNRWISRKDFLSPSTAQCAQRTAIPCSSISIRPSARECVISSQPTYAVVYIPETEPTLSAATSRDAGDGKSRVP
jgi:hypothetical protein